MKKCQNLPAKATAVVCWKPTSPEAISEVLKEKCNVSLSCIVNHLEKELLTGNVIKKINGVQAGKEDIELKFDAKSNSEHDAEILKHVLNGLKVNWEVPKNKVMVTVSAGWVTLEGELEWNHQKNAAKSAANIQIGVTGVTNNIKIKTTKQIEIIKKEIEQALNRNRCIDKGDVIVKVLANHVTLTGIVNSFYEKDEAERITRNAQGVLTVANELIIEYH